MSENRVDKKVYNFKTALEQPIWIQKLSKKITLPNAIKLSTLVWTASIFAIYFWFVMKFLRHTPFPPIFWFSLGGVPSWSLGIILADLKIEEQSIGRFVKDFLRYYRKYGRLRSKKYLNDGLFYHKHQNKLNTERRMSESRK